jgi:CheY-like chemotaxis protein
MEELFIPFTRLGADRDEVEGTGLGLALSQRLVAAMGGELRVESTPGVGSTFWIDLPLARTPVEELRETVPRAGDADRQAAAPATLLYIEDNLANLTLIETILAARPELTLVPALQGRLGVELAWEHLPDLILLDLHLPDIPGEEVLRRLRSDERTRDTPVLVISADATPGQVERLKEAGADGYLTKPLDVDGFLAEVDGLLTRRGEGG